MLKTRTILVLGLGESGCAASHLLLEQGHTVHIVDENPARCEGEPADVLRRAGAQVQCGRAALPDGVWDQAVVSPGFAPEHPWLLQLASAGVPVWSELDVARQAYPGHLIAVTGSNGKSTIVKLCSEILAAAGIQQEPAGNYGTAFSEVVRRYPDAPWLVAEVSSFQLETCHPLRPDAALLLNIQPDHLDRHGSMAQYRALKYRLFAQMGAGSCAVIPFCEMKKATGSLPVGVRCLCVGTERIADVGYAEGRLMFPGLGGDFDDMDIAGTYFDNPVLGPQAGALAAALLHSGFAHTQIAEGIRRFVPLPHRFQFLAKIRGVSYVNDSKATNLSATSAALSMARGPIRLIAGGRLKGENVEEIKSLLAKHVVKAYLIGEGAEELALAWRDAVSVSRCGDLAHAVEAAANDARAGEVVLLSPGAASFDQFSSFRERGNVFSHLIEQL